MHTEEALAIGSIRTDGGTQMRARINAQTVAEYATLMREDVRFPPIGVVRDETGTLWAWDGFTRLAASRLAHATTISALVQPGTLSDAIWLATSANQAHGQPRTLGDKTRAVEVALRHPTSHDKSARAIAKHVGVSHTLVADIRKRLAATGESPAHTVKPPAAARIGRGSPIRQLASWWKQAPSDERSALRAWVLAQDDTAHVTTTVAA